MRVSAGHLLLSAICQPPPLALPYPQMAVLMLFNDAESLTYEEVAAATAIPEDDLKRVLQSLACVKVGLALLLLGACIAAAGGVQGCCCCAASREAAGGALLQLRRAPPCAHTRPSAVSATCPPNQSRSPPAGQGGAAQGADEQGREAGGRLFRQRRLHLQALQGQDRHKHSP